MGVSISVIMSTGTGRYPLLSRSLQSWEHLIQSSWLPIDFTLIVNSDDRNKALAYKEIYSHKHPFITKFVLQPLEQLHRIFRREGQASTGDFVVFSLADELIGDTRLLDVMLKVKPTRRYTTNTYFLKEAHMEVLDETDWLKSPRMLECLPDFWDHTEWENNSNRNRKDGHVLAHITGAYRSYWDWIGWFRNDEHGYLNYDRDLAVREEFLGVPAVSYQYPCCYHQWHTPVVPADIERLPGYVYETEAQARLLEPAKMEGCDDPKL